MHLARCAATALLVSAALPASAGEPAPLAVPVGVGDPGTFYVSGGGFGQFQSRPSFTYGGTFVDGAVRTTTLSADVAGGGPALTLGYVVPDGALARIGTRTRIELGFSYFRGSGADDASVSGPASTAIYDLRLLDGTNCCISFFSTVPPQRYSATHALRVSVGQFDTGLRVRTDFALAPDLTLTPTLGIVGGLDHTQLRYRFTENFGTFMGGGPIRTGEVEQAIRSGHFGGEAGGHLTWQATTRLQIHGGATLAVIHRRASFSGRDCYTSSSFGTGCGPGQASSVTGSRSTTGLRLGLSLGGSYDFGRIRLGVLGFGRYDSAVPGVQNPEALATTGGAFTAPIAPARLRFSGRWSGGGLVTVRIPLG